MAGAEGLEPSVPVLETGGLPVNRRPLQTAPPSANGRRGGGLLRFFMNGVFAAGLAELLQFQLFFAAPATYVVVIPVVALRAGQHKHKTIGRHDSSPSILIAEFR